jgi:putative membrane protein
MEISMKQNPKMNWVIGVVSVLIPVVVSLLFYAQRTGNSIGNADVGFLPHFNAVLNTSTFISLLVGFYAIKKQNIALHRTMMMVAFCLSSIFLVSYVIYHSQGHQVAFGGEGAIRYFYFFVLLTHILLSAVVVPFVLFSIYFAVSGQLSKHKKLVKWTFPIWTYVAASGVLVYLMISPYYK